MANKQHIFKAAGAPVAAPTEDGHHYVDTTAKEMYFSVGTATVADWVKLGSTPTGTPNTFAYFTGAGDLQTLSGWSVNTVNGLDLNRNLNPNNLGGGNYLNSLYAGFIPLQNSPAESWNVITNFIDLDPTSTGFTMGTGGGFVTYSNTHISHQGTGDVGSIEYFRNTAAIGNGTDPIDVKGMSYSLFLPSFNANVNISGGVTGYLFGPSFNAATTFDVASNITAFSDTANGVGATFTEGYLSINLSPQIGTISNNRNFQGISINPNVSTFVGNAGVTLLAMNGNYGTFGASGNFQGIQMNPAIASGKDATGININMSNVIASGTVRAMDITGDVNINGSLTFSGALSIGKLTAFGTQAVIDGGGSPQTIHSLISSPTVANGLTIANCDTIGVNTASLMTIGTGCTLTSGGFALGLASLALPSLVQIGAGSTLDFVSGGVFALNMAGGSGTVDIAKGCRSVFIGDGTTTVNRFYAMSCETLGLGATENWGVHANSVEYNFMQSLKIGGTAGVTDKVSNASTALEIESTTKAFRLSNMTTVQKNALTALAGMMVFDTDLAQVCYYDGVTWIAI